MGVTRNLVFPLIYGFQNTDFIRVPQDFLLDDTLMHNTGFFGAKTSVLSRAMLFFGRHNGKYTIDSLHENCVNRAGLKSAQ